MAGLHGDELGQLSDTARKVIRRNHRPGTSGCSLSFVHIRHLYAEPTGIYQSESDSDSEQYLDEYRKGATHVHSCRKGKPIENYSSQGFEERYLAKGENTITMDLNCPNAKLWNPDSPHLYVCRVELKSAKEYGMQIPGLSVSAGLNRQGLEKDAQLRLNGQRVMLLTAISWGYWPVGGLYATPEMAEKQILTAKALGLNMLNFHRSIGSPVVLEKADELGLLYLEEPGSFPPQDTIPSSGP